MRVLQDGEVSFFWKRIPYQEFIRHREESFHDFSLEREWKFYPGPVGRYRVI